MSCKSGYENGERKIAIISGVAHVSGVRLPELTTRIYYPDTQEIREVADKLYTLLDIGMGEIYDALPSNTEPAFIEAILRLHLAQAEAELELDIIKNQHTNWNRPKDVTISQQNVTAQKQIIEDFLSAKTPSTDVQLRLDSLRRSFRAITFERETGERYDFKVHEPRNEPLDDPGIRAYFDQFIAERPLLTETQKSFLRMVRTAVNHGMSITSDGLRGQPFRRIGKIDEMFSSDQVQEIVDFANQFLAGKLKEEQ